jgi:hypothetical protein
MVAWETMSGRVESTWPTFDVERSEPLQRAAERLGSPDLEDLGVERAVAPPAPAGARLAGEQHTEHPGHLMHPVALPHRSPLSFARQRGR